MLKERPAFPPPSDFLPRIRRLWSAERQDLGDGTGERKRPWKGFIKEPVGFQADAVIPAAVAPQCEKSPATMTEPLGSP